jgi:hypothetical protein
MIGDVEDFSEMEILYAPAESYDSSQMGSLQDSIVMMIFVILGCEGSSGKRSYDCADTTPLGYPRARET